VAEDWRVSANLHEQDAGRLMRALHTAEIEGDTRSQLGRRVAVSGQDDHVFLYADTESAARAAADVLTAVLREHELEADLDVERWDHEADVWETPSGVATSPPDASPDSSDVAEWEVRVELASHHDAHALAERLESERIDCVRRWKYLLVGAASEDDANALASRLQAEAPGGSTVHVEPGSGLAWQLQPGNPFAIFGGLAG
jgi:hypothetical protein